MALKDLVADRGKITEEMIEKIIADYIRYDPGTYEIVFTRAGMALGNDAKVLVMLVAILGWKYVTDETRSVDTRPAALEALTGIHGGSLRPTLKKLKDSRLLAVVDGHYSVKVANLEAIASTVAGEKALAPAKRTAGKADKIAKTLSPDEQATIQTGQTSRRKSVVPIRASLDRLVKDDFFSEVRTLPQVLAELHERAIIAKTTSLSGPIADLVRNGTLKRKKVINGNKEIWGYRAA